MNITKVILDCNNIGTWFWGLTGLKEVTMGNSVTSINDFAFQNCSGLTTVSIPNSLINIGYKSFYGCGSLTSITIPNNVTTIGDNAFEGCSELTSVTINNNTFASNSYSSSSTLANIFGSQVTEYIFGDNVQSIGQYACCNCSNLTDVSIGNGVTNIGVSAFSGCTGLNSVIIPKGVTSIGQDAFCDCSELTQVSIPQTVSVLPQGVFCRTKLKEIVLPEGITTIGLNAFCDCTELVQASISSTVVTLEQGVFARTKLKEVVLPDAVMTLGKYAFLDCVEMTSLSIGSGLTSVGKSAFAGCNNLANVSLNCVNIGTWFQGLKSIKKLTFGNNVQTINSSTFSGCNKLETATIGDNVTSIGIYAFPTSTNFFVNRGTPSLLSLWNAGYLSPYQMGTENILSASSLAVEGATQMTATVKVENFYDDMENTLDDEVLTEDTKVYNGYPDYKKEATLKVYKNGVTYTPASISYQMLPISPTVERAEGTASSMVAKASYLEGDAEVTSQVLTINGVSVEGDSMYLNGLKPNTNYEAVYTIKVNDEYEYTGKVNLKTDALTFQNELPKVISEGNIIVASQSNLDYAEENVGFQWRRNDWTADFESKSAGAYLYEGMIEGYIRNLNTNFLWKFRPYYQSADGSYFYGSWSGMDPTDFSYFEPTVHTYNQTTVNGNSVEVKGYAQRGTDNVASQGFLYWKTTSPQPSPKAREMKAPSIPSDAKKVEASGTVMVASLTDLDYDTDYNYVAYITTSENETFYGDMRSFRTGEAPTGIESIENETMRNGENEKGIYDLSGRKVSNNGQLTMDNGKLRKGIYIVNGKKTIVK